MSETPQASTDPIESTPKIGNLTARANISDEIKRALVPGEVAYKHWPEMFRRNQPAMISEDLKATQIQIDEWGTYQPCAICHRRRYDPYCKCLSQP